MRAVAIDVDVDRIRCVVVRCILAMSLCCAQRDQGRDQIAARNWRRQCKSSDRGVTMEQWYGI